ncbi:hypothetical protein GWK47_041770 [Chionoecetes opilio]|uniref:Uncharacterized protein n=1 Tax=Chionoecetes opilio TaxID=41210 RepID=A0A8J4YC30_CHIOP|nr:hypothetical protein GWK47_041770 [Chionoecetes opilio]
MATLIRIKRRMDEEPLDSILVRPKWRKVDVGVDEEVVASALPSSAVVELVATVDSKETSVEPKLLRKYRKGWELKQKYKSLEPLEDRKDVERKAAKDRVKERRHLAVATLRGTVTTTTTTTEEEIEQEATGSTANGEMDDADDDTVHYYDTHISSKDQKGRNHLQWTADGV